MNDFTAFLIVAGAFLSGFVLGGFLVYTFVWDNRPKRLVVIKGETKNVK